MTSTIPSGSSITKLGPLTMESPGVLLLATAIGFMLAGTAAAPYAAGILVLADLQQIVKWKG